MNRKDKKTLIGVTLIIIGLFLGYNYYIQSTTPLSQSFISWTQNDESVDKAIVNQVTALNVNLISNSVLGYNGNVIVQIKKDYVNVPDEVIKSQVVQLNIPPGIGSSQKVKIDFTPNEKTGVLSAAGISISGLREYFYKITTSDDKVVYNPQTPGERNGLLVYNPSDTGNVVGNIIDTIGNIISGGSSQVKLKKVDWSVAGNQQSTATLTFGLTGTVSKGFVIDIRKDNSVALGGCTLTNLCLDDNIASLSVTLSGTNTDVVKTITFTAPEAGSRIFVRVSGVYDVTDQTTRINQVTEIIVPASSSTSTGGGTTPQPTQTPSGAKVSFNAAEFVTDYEGGLNIRVPTGTTVQIYANLNTNQPTTGTINIEVKKDMVWATDTTVQNIQRSITLPIVGNNNIQIGTFVASDLTDFSFRQYFVKVSWNGNVIYDPTDPNNRETVTTCSSNTQWC